MRNHCGFLTPVEKSAVSTSEMHAIEERGVQMGISRLLMMENAGANIARFVFDYFSINSAASLDNSHSKLDQKMTVLLVAGTGNNGGDAFVAARHLAYWKNRFSITLVLLGKGDDIKAEEALYNWNILKEIAQVQLIEIDSNDKIELLKGKMLLADVIVVGIFGTGFKGRPREVQGNAIETINSNKTAVVISVDIPSGQEADSGLSESAVLSDFTVTMHSPKMGMLRDETTKQICGEILVANIGIPL